MLGAIASHTLHCQSPGSSLEHFVCFSSIVATLGNAGAPCTQNFAPLLMLGAIASHTLHCQLPGSASLQRCTCCGADCDPQH